MMMHNEYDDPFPQSASSREQYTNRSISLFESIKEVNKGKGKLLLPHLFDRKRYTVRCVTDKEIVTLEGHKCRCSCKDWGLIRLMYSNENSIHETDHNNFDENNLSAYISDQITDCCFSGFVVLGIILPTNVPSRHSILKNEDGNINKPHDRVLNPGVHKNICIHNCILEPGCRIYGNGIVEHTHVYPYASVIHCGTITNSAAGVSFKKGNMDCEFGSQLKIGVGPETGGERMIRTFPEFTMIDACHELCISTADPKQQNKSHTKHEQYETSFQKLSKCPLNILLAHSSVYNNSNTISNVYLSHHASIHSSSTVSNVTLLPHSTISCNSNVADACLQWNASISKSAVVQNTLVMESSSISTSAIVHSSILGPDVHLEGGETHHSLIGPSVNSHHQSLLIGVIWPCGRGNVGYGANVGSNHTGRIPDQECWAGEGIFWGLSNVIKFPVNLIGSPYSIIAAGATLHPQILDMPFSLILEHQMIRPGWVLGHSPYTIARSEQKFVKRRKALRHKFYTGWNIMRPSIVQMCFHARNRLMSNMEKNNVVKGIGKCTLTDAAKREGIQFYTKYIQRYALRGLLNQLDQMSDSICNNYDALIPSLSAPTPTTSLDTCPKGNLMFLLPWDEPSFHKPEEEWNYQLSLLLHEFPNTTLPDLLRQLILLELDHADRVKYSKSKDDYRGKKTIPLYKDVHVAAEDDNVVQTVALEAVAIRSKVEQILGSERMKMMHPRSRM